MKKGSTLFLKLVIGFIGLAVLVGMIRFPQTEGRAQNLDLISIYNDPFIIYLYIASIPFFVGLYQAINLLGFIEQKKIFSKNAVRVLKNMRNCALLVIGFIIGAAAFIRFTVKDDDPAGFIALCLLASFASAIVATTTHIFANQIQKRLPKAKK